MHKMNSAIGVVGVVVVALATAATTRAESGALPDQQRARIRRTPVDDGFPFAAVEFDTEVKIDSGDGTVGDLFGVRVAISGDTAIVGAYGDDDNGSASGSAYVYRRDENGADNWGEVTKITASDAASSDFFGFSVAISGDLVIVGSSGDDDNGSGSGSAYVYRRNKGGTDNWGEVAKITASDGAAGDQFGYSVAISGDTAIVGAIRQDDNGDDSGSAYVYQREEGRVDNWREVAKIVASDGAALDYFGIPVVISGDTVIVAAQADDDNGPNSGSTYVYYRDKGGADNWGEVTKITASDAAAEDAFGRSVAISGDSVIVGSPGDDDNGSSSGSVYLYERHDGGLDNWGEVAKVTASDGAAHDGFGVSVAIRGDTAIVGAQTDADNVSFSGSTYVYHRDKSGADKWGEVTKITASDAAASDQFGGSVAISGDSVIVGSPGDDDNGFASGSAYVYFETRGCLDDVECADGLFCNGDELCVTETGECLPGTPTDCDDGDDCNGVESCDPQADRCSDGEIDDCDDNGIDDACDMADCGRNPGCDDCDGNGSLDRCDITGGQPDVNGNGVLDQCESCTDNASCDDSNLCSFDRCIDNLCFFDLDAKYGDVAGVGGVCGPNGDVNLLDILAILNAFAGEYPERCEPVNMDIAGDAGSCVPNNSIDLSDILGVLDAFQGQDNCCAGRR